jgi:5-amino-6-(5-phosphoribosylamino)uracil reductase
MAGRPYVLVSAAMSADGYLDDVSPQRLILSGPEDLDRVDEERARCDAIMVGAQTIRSDDPQLLVRSVQRRERRQAAGRPASPAKVTLTVSGDLDAAARFFADDGTAKLVYAAAPAAGSLQRRLGSRATVISAPARGAPGRAALAWALADLAERGIGRLMIEGGAQVIGQALAGGLADELQLAIAPVFVADPAAPRLLAGDALARGVRLGRMTLAGTGQAGDMAVLRYLPGGQPAG